MSIKFLKQMFMLLLIEFFFKIIGILMILKNKTIYLNNFVLYYGKIKLYISLKS
jgi:hypothetical protein